MNNPSLRLVNESDAEALLAIYRPYVEHTAITCEYETPSAEEFRNRIMEISADYPYIVCISDEKIIGYAYAHRQMERAAYQWNAELSVYVDGAFHRNGIGRALYSALIGILRLQNVRNVYGGVTSPNPNSESLHEHLGFKKLGVYHNTAYKFGAWHDVAWFEKALGDHALDPEPFISIREIDKNAVTGILSRF